MYNLYLIFIHSFYCEQQCISFTGATSLYIPACTCARNSREFSGVLLRSSYICSLLFHAWRTSLTSPRENHSLKDSD